MLGRLSLLTSFLQLSECNAVSSYLHCVFEVKYYTEAFSSESQLVPACSGEWRISGAHQLDLIDPRILTIAAAERQFLEAEYDEYASANASGAACCRSAALIVCIKPISISFRLLIVALMSLLLDWSVGD